MRTRKTKSFFPGTKTFPERNLNQIKQQRTLPSHTTWKSETSLAHAHEEVVSWYKMAAVNFRRLFLLCVFLPVYIKCLPEAGVKTLKFDEVCIIYLLEPDMGALLLSLLSNFSRTYSNCRALGLKLNPWLCFCFQKNHIKAFPKSLFKDAVIAMKGKYIYNLFKCSLKIL